MIRLALPVARRLGVPLLTQVWDHPSWWLDAHMVDPLTSWSVVRIFDRVLRNRACIGTPSFVMEEEYRKKYGVPAINLIASINRESVLPPSAKPPLFSADHDTILIGLAGQIYAKQEWNSLIASLDSVEWTLAGKKVKIRFLGREQEVQGTPIGKDRLELLGYRSQDETIRLMAECDILYCPYFFDERRIEIARTSYPSKVTTYLASGRPIFFHGPDYSAPAIFLKQNHAAELCHALDADDVVQTLSRLALDEEHYRMIAKNGHATLVKHLTFDSLEQKFRRFIGFEDN